MIKRDNRKYSICIVAGSEKDTHYKHLGKKDPAKCDSGQAKALKEAQRLANETGSKVTVLTSVYNVYPDNMGCIDGYSREEGCPGSLQGETTCEGCKSYRAMIAKVQNNLYDAGKNCEPLNLTEGGGDFVELSNEEHDAKAFEELANDGYQSPPVYETEEERYGSCAPTKEQMDMDFNRQTIEEIDAKLFGGE